MGWNELTFNRCVIRKLIKKHVGIFSMDRFKSIINYDLFMEITLNV